MCIHEVVTNKEGVDSISSLKASVIYSYITWGQKQSFLSWSLKD